MLCGANHSRRVAPALLPVSDFSAGGGGSKRPDLTAGRGAKLVPSFDGWTAYPPCATGPAVPVDLFLCFSQNLTADAEAANATQTIIREFNAQQANESALGRLHRGSVQLPPQCAFFEAQAAPLLSRL